MGNEFAEIFQEEAGGLLDNLEQDLLDLEQAPENSDIVDRVFRTMHTIKGSGAMFGFADVADFTHHVENVLADVRTGALPISHELISLILQSRDHITSLIADPDPDLSKGPLLIEKLGQLSSAELSVPLEDVPEPASSVQDIKTAEDTPAVDAVNVEDLIATCTAIAGDLFVLVGTPDDKEILGRVRDGFHFLAQAMTQLGWHDFAGFPQEVIRSIDRTMAQGDATLPFLDLCDTARNFLEDVLHKGSPPAQKTYQDLLNNLASEVGLSPVAETIADEVIGEDISPEVVESPDDSKDRIGDILVEKGHVAEDILADVIEQQKPIGEMLVSAEVVTQDHIDEALKEQQKRRAVKVAKAVQSTAIKTDSIRVAAEKLDVLINLVGELVVTQARLSEIGGAHPESALLESIEDVERLTTELRECVLSVRMLPIGSTFARFKRLVRDLSNDLGKDVQLLTTGAETELDKTMLEMLADSLVHIIRNAVDHGIETPEERERKGKASFGTISLSAVHSGPNVVVTISDDGKGIDSKALLEKGVALGLVPVDMVATDRKVLELIFHPGMSTSKEINAVSGRGVGMDVVHSSIRSLKGTVTVTSLPETGTTLTLTLPLTMSIIDGLLVQSADTRFILPLLQIEECVELLDHGVSRRNGRHVYQFRDTLIPFIRLREFYDFEGDLPELEQMVIVRLKKEFIGIVVDHVIGDHQTVIKSLGWVYREAPGLSGATILGDGRVALILDVLGIHGHAMAEEQCVV